MLTLRKDEKLQVLLAGAVSATELPLVVEFDELGGRASSKTADGITTGNTAVDLLTGNASPRKVKSFSAHNADSASVTITVRFYNAATTTRILKKAVLLTNESLHWNELRGWYALDASGNLKQSTAADVTASSSQASSLASGIVIASVNSVSSQASSMAALTPASVSSLASLAALTSQQISGASSFAFTSTNWSTASSTVSRTKSSFSW